MAGGDDDRLPDLSPEALARAEKALAALSDDYLAWAGADLARLRAALDPPQLDRLFAVAHDMKGQAGTFNFPLVTDLANRLCRVLEVHPMDFARVRTLVDALDEVLSRRLEGDGGEEGRRLLERLG